MSVGISCRIQRLAAGSVLVSLLASPAAAQGMVQPLSPREAAAGTAAPPTDGGGFERVLLSAGRSTVLNTTFDITRIAVTNPAVADAVVVQPREILIDGKSAGTVSLIVWGLSGSRTQYDLVVEPPVTTTLASANPRSMLTPHCIVACDRRCR